MLRDNLVELIEPMLNSAGAARLAMYIQNRTQASDDRLPCLKKPRPEGAESSLTESASSPFQAEPAQPVAVLLLFNALLLIGAHLLFDKAHRHEDSVVFSFLFLCSGMPALIYQIVWQRVLFSIYGVNSQSVVVVVTAFMVGLGIGSLAGGRLSARFPRRAFLIFGLAALG